jgi:hypothetical protein
VFVADLNDDDMVRGIQRHVLGDLACKVHRMTFGRAQISERLCRKPFVSEFQLLGWRPQ